jgi:hypothetical protein
MGIPDISFAMTDHVFLLMANMCISAIGPWQPEAEGRDRKEGRPDPELDEGEGNAHLLDKKIKGLAEAGGDDPWKYPTGYTSPPYFC